MSTLIQTLQDNHSDMYDRATTQVELRSIEHVSADFFKLNKPTYAVLDMKNNSAIHLHGSNYQLVPYTRILNGLSEALEEYGITLDNLSLIHI